MMTPDKESVECCMCGDHGLSQELFQCKICQFRSQHRYCSNQYPKAESYRVCNWCLIQTHDETAQAKSTNTSSDSNNSSHSHQDRINEDDAAKSKRPRRARIEDHGVGGGGGGGDNNLISKGLQRPMNLRLQVNGGVKKEKSPETDQRSPLTPTPTTPRRRIITRGALEEKLRRTKSEEISHGGANGKGMIARPAFRSKVRRYKLLDEVSS